MEAGASAVSLARISTAGFSLPAWANLMALAISWSMFGAISNSYKKTCGGFGVMRQIPAVLVNQWWRMV